MGVVRYPFRRQGPRVANEPFGSQRDAASVIFHLSDDRVIDAVELPVGGRGVIVRADEVAAGGP